MTALGNVVYTRCGGNAPRSYLHTSWVQSGPVLIVDLRGENAVAPLRDRLLEVVSPTTPRIVVLRGAGPILEGESLMNY
jgi:hypothetical protein